MSGMEFTSGIAQVVVIAVGGLLIMRGKMDYVDLVTFSLYVSAFVSPVRRLAQFSEIYMQGMAGFRSCRPSPPSPMPRTPGSSPT